MRISPLNGVLQKLGLEAVACSQPLARKIGPKLWQLEEPCNFAWTDQGQPVSLTVPAQFQFDGASIPRRFRDTVDPEEAFTGSVLHDYLYVTQGGAREPLVDSLSGRVLCLDRTRSDALLGAFWLHTGMGAASAELGYAAVRLFGGREWEDDD
jgi:hypothetical protein